MSIEQIGFIQPGLESGSMGSAEKVRGDFTQWFDKELNEVNKQIADADKAVQALATGDSENLHQVMIALEKAKLSFELVVQVRNKLLEAYQEVMRMQV